MSIVFPGDKIVFNQKVRVIKQKSFLQKVLEIDPASTENDVKEIEKNMFWSPIYLDLQLNDGSVFNDVCFLTKIKYDYSRLYLLIDYILNRGKIRYINKV